MCRKIGIENKIIQIKELPKEHISTLCICFVFMHVRKDNEEAPENLYHIKSAKQRQQNV